VPLTSAQMVVGAGGCPGLLITAPSDVAGPTVVGEMPANLGALQAELDPKQQARLADASAIDLGFPHESLRRLDLTS
jgi:hypothetical protein